MTPSSIEAAATALVEARRSRTLLTSLPADIVPPTTADGYAVQSAFMKLWGDKVAGWKIGATAKPLLDKFGLREPFAGPFFVSDVAASPARPLAAEHPHLCIEAEFAFRFARPLEPRPTPYTRMAVLEAIGAVVPAFELVGPRFDRVLFDAVPTVIADCGLNAAMVLGRDFTGWRQLDLVRHPVRYSVDGKPRAEGSGAAVMGDPLAVVEWAVNHLSKRGVTLEAGQVVSTGATTGLMYLEPGEIGVADFGVLGQIEVSFTGPRSSLQVRRG